MVAIRNDVNIYSMFAHRSEKSPIHIEVKFNLVFDVAPFLTLEA